MEVQPLQAHFLGLKCFLKLMGEILEFGGSYPMEVQLLEVQFLTLKFFLELMGESLEK